MKLPYTIIRTGTDAGALIRRPPRSASSLLLPIIWGTRLPGSRVIGSCMEALRHSGFSVVVRILLASRTLWRQAIDSSRIGLRYSRWNSRESDDAVISWQAICCSAMAHTAAGRIIFEPSIVMAVVRIWISVVVEFIIHAPLLPDISGTSAIRLPTFPNHRATHTTSIFADHSYSSDAP